MNSRPLLVTLCCLALLSVNACKRKPTPRTPAIAAAMPSQPVVGMAPALAAAPAAQPARDPLWPQWLPVIDSVQRRMGGRDLFEGHATTGGLVTLINARRSFELQGYTLSQTTVRRQSWEQRFIFSATRGGEFTRVEVVGFPSRPNFSTVTATSGALARTMASRSR